MKRGMGQALAAAALLSGWLHAARAAEEEVVIPIVWDAAGRFEQELEMPADAMVEACAKLSLGARTRWNFKSSAPLDFNIHYHVDKRVETPVKKTEAIRADETFVAKAAQEYCWMWTNKSAKSVKLQMQFERREPKR